RFSKSTKFSERTCGISGSWFAMKSSSRKSERNLPGNTNSNWSRRFAATFVTHGGIAFKWSIFTMNHWCGCCPIERCRTRVSSSDDRFKLTGERPPCEKAMRGRIPITITWFESVGGGDYISRKLLECALTARLYARPRVAFATEELNETYA